MKIGRFLNGSKVIEGRIEDGEVVTTSDERLKIKDLKYLSPVTPSKIICVGLNYVDHAKEMKMEIPQEPILFLKAPSAVIGHEDIVRYPRTTQKLDH